MGQTVNLLAMPSVVRIHLPPPMPSEPQRRAAQQDTLWAEVFRAYLRRHPEALDALEEDTECISTCC